MVRRKEGWERRFSEYIAESMNKPFKWGENDCVLFSAKGFECITGINFYSSHLPYNTEKKAYKIVSENQGLQSMISEYLGNPHMNYREAKRGDIVLMRLPQETIGIVDDSGQSIMSVNEKGISRLPLKSAKFIWSY